MQQDEDYSPDYDYGSSNTSSISNNPAGRMKTADARPYYTAAGCLSVLNFCCLKKCPVQCQGVYVPLEKQENSKGDLSDEAVSLCNAVASIRTTHHLNLLPQGRKRMGNKQAAVTQLLWSLTPNDAPVDPKKLVYTVGHRQVGRDCY